MSAPSVVEDIFLAALEKNIPEKRAAFLDAACKDDLDLRRRVERLLGAYPKAGDFLEAPARPAGEETAAYVIAGEEVGAVIAGRYKLLEQIGEGGMGTVWVAEQMQPVRRKVALKLIKPGMDSKTVLSRFDAERQALAVMDHPNIAKVLDGGTTEAGRPFFVMEYVKGIPFTKYCDDTRLSIAERLALFVPVCQAVQHAHQKGVIHRDLKPSNILVCLYDGKPVPKVIDFGLAKAIHQPLTEHTLHTAHGAMMGTPLYMSPEQAEFNNFDVDTRTDIYALGVILYELLTGTTPLEKQRFQEAAWLEMLRLIKEEEPQRPSARLSGSATLPSLAAQRQLEPIKLPKLVRGELDWIVMKCLEKDRSRRYDTATGLARDVERYLADEMVEARPPTAWYRLRKFARKHRVGLTTTIAFAGLLTVAAVVSGCLAVQAKRAETVADEKRIEAEENAARAEANAKEAQQNWGAWDKTSGQLRETIEKGQIRILGLQVDLDLAEMRTDQRIGLLRLAHPLKDTWEMKEYGPNYIGESHARFKSDYPPLLELREFVTAGVLAVGQNYAPLLPPITHDGHVVAFASLSPDNQTLLTLGKDHTARLWNARTARPITVLQKGDEQVVNCGFSPDGRTVFTDDQSSVARFWDVPTGRFRTAIEARQNRYDVPDGWLFGDNSDKSVTPKAAQLSASRLLTRRRVGKESKVMGASPDLDWEGPAELWDSATGRLVARLDAPGRDVRTLQFANGGQWITMLQDSSTLLVFSADDGHLLAQLSHPAGESVVAVDVGPSGRRLATLTGGGSSRSLRIWDAETWGAGPVTTPLTFPESFVQRFRFWMDDLPESPREIIALEESGWQVSGWTVYRYGQDQPAAQFAGAAPWPDLLARVGDLAHGGDGRVYNIRTWQRIAPPPGRKFHPDLARFSLDGQFVRAVVNGEQALIDARTDKSFPLQGHWGALPKFGIIAAMSSDDEATIRLIPSGSLLDLPADLLELWAQVAVRGELDAEGRFVAWNEATWEKKRQELAAKPAPYPDFPFPGHVATDRLHWLRAEFGEAKTDADKLRIARDLLRQAESASDRAETVRWRIEVDRRVPEVVSPPRPVKP